MILKQISPSPVVIQKVHCFMNLCAFFFICSLSLCATDYYYRNPPVVIRIVIHGLQIPNLCHGVIRLGVDPSQYEGITYSTNTPSVRVQWNLSNTTRSGSDILCQNRQGVGLHGVEHTENDKKRHENQRWITQGNELLRCRIRQGLLYLKRFAKQINHRWLQYDCLLVSCEKICIDM